MNLINRQVKHSSMAAIALTLLAALIVFAGIAIPAQAQTYPVRFPDPSTFLVNNVVSGSGSDVQAAAVGKPIRQAAQVRLICASGSRSLTKVGAPLLRVLCAGVGYHAKLSPQLVSWLIGAGARRSSPRSGFVFSVLSFCAKPCSPSATEPHSIPESTAK